MNIETLKSIQFPQIKNQHLVIGLALIFSIASIQNVAHFFVGLGHDRLASWTLGLGLGVALVVLAHQLSEVDMRDKQAFYSLLSVTAFFTILSALIQGSVYSHHLGWLGYLLAFFLIGCSELALPIATSISAESKRKRKILDAGTLAREKGAEILVSTLDFDTAKLQRKAESIMMDVVLANVSQIADEMTPRTRRNVTDKRNVVVTAPTEPDTIERQPAEMSQVIVSPADMTAARQDKAATRQQEIMSYVDSQDVSVFVKSMAQLFSVSERTIRRDLDKLESDGLVIANGVIIRAETLAVA